MIVLEKYDKIPGLSTLVRILPISEEFVSAWWYQAGEIIKKKKKSESHYQATPPCS